MHASRIGWKLVLGLLLGVGAAVTQAEAQGRDILLTGLEGLEPNLKMIAEGGPQDLAAGSPGGCSKLPFFLLRRRKREEGRGKKEEGRGNKK